MAGETALPSSECPDIFQYISVTLKADTEDATIGLDHYILYCEKDTIVDAAWFSFTTADAGDDARFMLAYVPSGTGPESASATAITNNTVMGGTADATVAWTITETANLVPAGNRIVLQIADVSGAGTSSAVASTLEGCNVTMRIRTRVR